MRAAAVSNHHSARQATKKQALEKTLLHFIHKKTPPGGGACLYGKLIKTYYGENDFLAVFLQPPPYKHVMEKTIRTNIRHSISIFQTFAKIFFIH